MIKIEPVDVLALGAVAAFAAAGVAAPELAPATGAIGGALGGVTYEHALGSLGAIFEDEQTKRRRYVVAAVAGLLSGAVLGILRRERGR